MRFSEQTAVRMENGGWQRLEDYCDSAEKGTGLHYTNGIIWASDEILAHELGERVLNAFLAWDLEYWDPLLDRLLEEEERTRAESPSS
jgi:hypothetical protein